MPRNSIYLKFYFADPGSRIGYFDVHHCPESKTNYRYEWHNDPVVYVSAAGPNPRQENSHQCSPKSDNLKHVAHPGNDLGS